ncbi:MAG TPA: hypothetical protein VI454_05715 [Verrucomicrobiae bacterium]|jgi:hypothetical protein
MKTHFPICALAAAMAFAAALASHGEESASGIRTALSHTVLSGYVNTALQWNLGASFDPPTVRIEIGGPRRVQASFSQFSLVPAEVHLDSGSGEHSFFFLPWSPGLAGWLRTAAHQPLSRAEDFLHSQLALPADRVFSGTFASSSRMNSVTFGGGPGLGLAANFSVHNNAGATGGFTHIINRPGGLFEGYDFLSVNTSLGNQVFGSSGTTAVANNALLVLTGNASFTNQLTVSGINTFTGLISNAVIFRASNSLANGSILFGSILSNNFGTLRLNTSTSIIATNGALYVTIPSNLLSGQLSIGVSAFPAILASSNPIVYLNDLLVTNYTLTSNAFSFSLASPLILSSNAPLATVSARPTEIAVALDETDDFKAAATGVGGDTSAGPIAVPEPSAFVLLALAGAVLVGRQLRRRL